MILIGITGVVGSGKTTVSGMLRKKGIEVIDLDKTAKEVAEREDVRNDIKEALGGHCITKDNIAVEKIRELVFKDKEKLKKLENIIHPKVGEQMYSKIKKLEKKGVKAIVIDAPLLFEKGLNKELNKIVVVSTDAVKTKERLKRRGMDEDDIDKRTAIQIPLKEKEAMADLVIHNNGTVEELEKEVDNLLSRIEAWEEELYAS
ncbi:MAG: dephospho-CoA kinase [Proteobacteria bacterium]|nr:dephospho-CoA kinase [Pseudomonadota bacterium]